MLRLLLPFFVLVASGCLAGSDSLGAIPLFEGCPEVAIATESFDGPACDGSAAPTQLMLDGTRFLAACEAQEAMGWLYGCHQERGFLPAQEPAGPPLLLEGQGLGLFVHELDPVSLAHVSTALAPYPAIEGVDRVVGPVRALTDATGVTVVALGYVYDAPESIDGTHVTVVLHLDDGVLSHRATYGGRPRDAARTESGVVVALEREPAYFGAPIEEPTVVALEDDGGVAWAWTDPLDATGTYVSHDRVAVGPNGEVAVHLGFGVFEGAKSHVVLFEEDGTERWRIRVPKVSGAAIAFDAEGEVIVGGRSPGRVYRDAEGRLHAERRELDVAHRILMQLDSSSGCPLSLREADAASVDWLAREELRVVSGGVLFGALGSEGEDRVFSFVAEDGESCVAARFEGSDFTMSELCELEDGRWLAADRWDAWVFDFVPSEEEP